MTPDRLFRFGACAAICGGALRIAAAFILYMPQSPHLEMFYALIDLLLLFGLGAIYLHEAARLGVSGLAAFSVTFAGLASIVGPDATAFGIDVYELGAALAALGLAAFGVRLIIAGRMILAAAAWVIVPIASLWNSDGLGFMIAGILFGLGFVTAGVDVLSQASHRKA